MIHDALPVTKTKDDGKRRDAKLRVLVIETLATLETIQEYGRVDASSCEVMRANLWKIMEELS